MAETADSADATAAPGQAAAGSAMSAAGMPMLRLGAYEGPLDLLLDLARAQRVDFASISMPDLSEQFAAAVEAAIAGARVPLGQMGDWLVAAATLIALRARPQLGRDVFARGWAPQQEEAGRPPAADITELLRACLRLLAQPLREAPYQPRPPPLWRVPAALAHIRRLLADCPPEGFTLAQLVPAPEQGGVSPLQRRASVASTLMAGLELSREGALVLDQKERFETVHFVLGASGGR
jgi:segregation and condensation protein A